jgi:enterochelin esterase-like enzyme
MDIGDGRERTPFSWFSMPRWSRPTFLETAPAHTGQVHTVTFQSPSLEQSLPLHLYLPAGFEPQTTIGLVVVHGGDAARAHGDWVRALDVLVGRTVAPIAVLFLPEEPLALDMEDYARVVGEEILPWVLHSYPTIGDARMRAHVGAGSIGYAALYTAWRYPDLVKRAGAQSVYMLDKMERALGALLLEVDLREWTLYLDWGRYDLRNTVEAWDMGTTNREWFERIKATGATVHGGEAPDGAGWPSWRNRTDALLQALFPLPP